LHVLSFVLAKFKRAVFIALPSRLLSLLSL